jgi:hypothetical protein
MPDRLKGGPDRLPTGPIVRRDSGMMAVMPNGKPGDHPLTDILVHKIEVFSPRADALIREIVELGGKAELDGDINLSALDPRFPSTEPVDLSRLEAQLESLRDRIRADRQQRGWEA